MCYKPSEFYDGCGCPRSKTMIIRCSAADLVDRYCEILKEFEERANNRVCERHYKELVKATEALLRSNGMLVEVHKALELEWEEEDTDDDSEDDSLLELVSEDGFGFDGIRSGGAVSGGGTQV